MFLWSFLLYLIFSLILFSFLKEGFSFFIGVSLLFMLTILPEGVFSAGFLLDGLSWGMVLLTLVLGMMTSLPSSSKKHHQNMVMMTTFLMIISMMFFLTSSMLMFLILFEVSLLPLLLMIILWGYQPERLVASQFMLLYTIFASSPLLVMVIFYKSLIGNSIYLSSFVFLNPKGLEFILITSLFAFFVKIPLFTFHSWLTKAHVEAPLEGSMILAGLMLKVGLYGYIRVSSIMEIDSWFLILIFSFSSIGAFYASILSLSSDDMKMSVAYSSISHMNIVFAAFLTSSMSGLNAAFTIMITHGVISPMLFYMVTKIYMKTNSRSLIISKGTFSKFPILGFFSLILWIMNLSTPPFFSFYGELMVISASLSFSAMTMIVLLFYLMVSSFYSMFNYAIQSHSPNKMTFFGSDTDLLFYLFVCFVVVLMLSLFISQSSLMNL